MRKYCSKTVVENFFEPCLLYLLLKNSSYGYEIQKNLKKNCICDVNTGNLYRCLARLRKQNLIVKTVMKSDKGPNINIYSITATGRKYLADWIESLKKQNDVISLLIKNYQKII